MGHEKGRRVEATRFVALYAPDHKHRMTGSVRFQFVQGEVKIAGRVHCVGKDEKAETYWEQILFHASG
jgi:hypothetical protein